jgi:hypothetical protein
MHRRVSRNGDGRSCPGRARDAIGRDHDDVGIRDRGRAMDVEWNLASKQQRERQGAPRRDDQGNRPADRRDRTSERLDVGVGRFRGAGRGRCRQPGDTSPQPCRPRCVNPQENIWQFMRANCLSNRVFKSYDDIVDHCCYAWNTLVDQPWKIMSIARRDWAEISQ